MTPNFGTDIVSLSLALSRSLSLVLTQQYSVTLSIPYFVYLL